MFTSRCCVFPCLFLTQLFDFVIPRGVFFSCLVDCQRYIHTQKGERARLVLYILRLFSLFPSYYRHLFEFIPIQSLISIISHFNLGLCCGLVMM